MHHLLSTSELLEYVSTWISHSLILQIRQFRSLILIFFSGDMFQTVDLYECNNIPSVIDGLYSLGRKCHSHENQDIPALGPKESDENKREFTEEQMNAGKLEIGLQMGTNKLASQAGQNFGKTRAIID